MTNDQFEKFVRLLHYSFIIDDRRVRDSIAEFRSLRSTDSEEACEETQFIEFLVANGILTKWQCDKLSAGKWRGFFVEKFLLLELVGQTEDVKTFRARDRYSGEEVLMGFPLPMVKDNLQFTVRPVSPTESERESEGVG